MYIYIYLYSDCKGILLPTRWLLYQALLQSQGLEFNPAGGTDGWTQARPSTGWVLELTVDGF